MQEECINYVIEYNDVFEKYVNYFIGQVMKENKNFNPQKVRKIIIEELCLLQAKT